MPLNFSWLLEGQIAGMAWPGPDAAAWLRRMGVGAVLSLTERPAEIDAEAHDLVHHHVPLQDFGTPSMAELEACARFIEAQLEAGRPVAVHCFAGIGRTGTVLAAWLVWTGRDPEEALAEVRRLRPGSVETGGQAEAIRRFGVAARERSGGGDANG